MLALALLLDAILGEPEALWRRAPHPVVLLGRLLAALEARLNRGGARRAKGALALALLLAAAGVPAWLLSWEGFGGVAEVALAAVLLAQRSLVEHVRAVAVAFRRSLPEGRRASRHGSFPGRGSAASPRWRSRPSCSRSAASSSTSGRWPSRSAARCRRGGGRSR
jgi:cobalamin biosynthesis protein CobD/CbiB